MIKSSTLFPNYASFSLRFVKGAPIRYQLLRSYKKLATISRTCIGRLMILSERLSQLLATIDSDSPEAEIIRSLIM
ncbi:hypothetical protein NC653_011388 [Populus alba x Populus x berolinensis]|uniref:Uncharacterized protein n=1 Tax=Populus alba x Populus x berolinensis TaxID=444605 RepID=A0AAD6R1Z0_9ROSI|nr:hypothetical protein NC653_011388 [Populus alba x Populus x berolinensis]